MEASDAILAKNGPALAGSLVSHVTSLLHDVGQQGFDEYATRATAHMPHETAEKELRSAIASLRSRFFRGLELASSGAFESMTHAVLSCSAAPSPSIAQVSGHLQQSSGDIPRKTLQTEVRILCEELQAMADQELALMASMRTKQYNLCMDTASLAEVKSIVDQAQQLECLVESCSEQMAQLKNEDALLASRKCADALIAESGVNEVQKALILCMGQDGETEQ